MTDINRIQALHAAISRRSWNDVEVAANAIRDTEEHRIRAALASLSHTMSENGLECHCTKIEQDETCPVGYPSLLCDDCDGKGIRSALTPAQQPVAWRWRFEVDGPWYHGSTDPAASKFMGGKPVQIEPLYALASPQAVPGWEKALEALEPFAKAADQRQVMCDNSERVTWSAITVGDLRRARTALEGK